MRTKLDEIVEEECREALPGAGAPRGGYLHRIAERAFRHGVEQRSLRMFNWTDDTVRPAQAEEKGVRSAAEARTENWGINDWIKEARDLAGQMIYDEDTKKCLLVLAAALEEKCGPHPTYLHCDVCGSVDRRSGKDRRK